MTWSLEGRPLRSVLISRLRYLGDVVMTTPLMQVLRHGDTSLRLGYLAEHSHGRILKGHPQVDRLHLLQTNRRSADAKRRARDAAGTGYLATLRQLRAADYDLAVDLFFNPRSSWLLRLAGIPHRIAGTLGSRRHLFTHTVRPSDFSGEDSRRLACAPGGLGEHLGRLAPLRHMESGLPFLHYLQEHFGSQVLKPYLPRPGGLEGTPLDGHPDPYILLAPGATWPSKEWPLQRWRELAGSLKEALGLGVCVLQPPGREEDFSFLARAADGTELRLLPAMDLPAAVRVLAGAALLVTVDGGIMHVAVGLGVPTVALFGPTDPALWFPYENAGPYRVLATRPDCAPCSRHTCDAFICLPDLESGTVLTAARELWARKENPLS